MGLQGLNYSLLQVPLASGLDTGGDKRASDPPSFDILTDAEFEEPGGLQTRYPYAAMSASIFGGGTLSDTRRIYANGDELLCFTKTALYTWNAKLSLWVLKGTHLAVKLDEESKFASTDDQIDCDRAELGGTIVYSWASGINGYVAAVDKVTGSVLMAPFLIVGGVERLRVLALTTKILLSFYDSGGFYCYMLDPAAPATALAGSSTTVYNTTSSGNAYYDVVKVPGADTALFACRLTPTTSYVIVKVTSALTVTSSVKARPCAGPITLSCEPTGTSVQIVRVDEIVGATKNIVGDYITISTLADVTINQAIGTALTLGNAAGKVVRRITAAHRSVQNSSAYRCYVFWTASLELIGSVSEEDNAAFDPTLLYDNSWGTKYNWVDTAGTIGTQGNFVRSMSPGSRAFDYNGSVYLWGSFVGESAETVSGAVEFRVSLQNAYFLYRDDITLHAKAAATRAGGFSSVGYLPGVALTSGSTYAWCGTERNVIELDGKRTGYGDRGPRDITFTFDSNEARRVARLGKSLYVAGGEVLVFDGSQLVECGFHTFPWLLDVAEVSPAVGNKLNGAYAYKMTWRWNNAHGEMDRSTCASITEITIADEPSGTAIDFINQLCITHKTANPASIEVWCTAADPTPDSPFFLVSSRDPSVTSNPNRYLASSTTAAPDATAFGDEYADTTTLRQEANPENGNVLENLAPPAASIILAAGDRVFLAGVAGDPDRVWYSKQRREGEIASFHDALTVEVPLTGGLITALAFHNEALVVFRETAIYVLLGQGLDNTGGGQNYGPATRVPGDVGAESAEAIASTPMGLLFKSAKGFYILGTRWECEYIGLQVNAYDGELVLAAHVVEDKHQVRLLTESRMLVFDYRVKQWTEWTTDFGISAAIWQGKHLYLDGDANIIMQQATTYSGVAYGMDVETAWFKPGGLQGRCTVRDVQILGEYRSGCRVRVRIARDYQQDGSGNWLYFDDEIWTVTPTVVGGPLQLRHGPSQKRCESMKIRLTVMGAGALTVPTGEALRFTGLALDVGVEPGLFRGLAAAQKQ